MGNPDLSRTTLKVLGIKQEDNKFNGNSQADNITRVSFIICRYDRIWCLFIVEIVFQTEKPKTIGIPEKMTIETKRLKIYFSIAVLFAGSLFSQNCQIALTTGESFNNLELNTLVGDTLVVSPPNGQSIQIPVEGIKEISIERKHNFNFQAKKVLTGTLIGVVLGSVSGLLFSDFALQWLSNDDNPKGWISNRHLSSGDEAIVKVFTGMSAIMGILHGYDWAVKEIKNRGYYDLSNKSKTEKKEIIDKMFKFQKEQ